MSDALPYDPAPLTHLLNAAYDNQDDRDRLSYDRIVVRRDTLERLESLLRKGYDRHHMREIKQAVDTVHHLLGHAP